MGAPNYAEKRKPLGQLMVSGITKRKGKKRKKVNENKRKVKEKKRKKKVKVKEKKRAIISKTLNIYQ